MKKILVVDDSDSLRDVLKSVLEDLYPTCLILDVDHPEKAKYFLSHPIVVERLQNQDMQIVVVTDQVMHADTMAGENFIDWIEGNSIFNKIPVILMTGTPQHVSEKRRQAVLGKPFQEKELVAKIDQAFS